MNKFFKITLCALSVVFSQAVLSETIYHSRTHTLTLEENFMKEATLQVNSDEAIVVASTTDCDSIIVVLHQGKLKIYYWHPPLDARLEIQEVFNGMDKKEAPHIFTDSNDPIFQAPEVNVKDFYYFNTKNCLINAEKSIDIQGNLIESPCIVLKTGYIEITSFLIGTQSIELQSNNKFSALVSIEFTLKDKTDFEFQPFITGGTDFDYNFVALMCSHVSKVELRFLPGSFYLTENTICFN